MKKKSNFEKKLKKKQKKTKKKKGKVRKKQKKGKVTKKKRRKESLWITVVIHSEMCVGNCDSPIPFRLCFNLI